MAQSDLIIMVFDNREDAPLARQALGLMRNRHVFGLELTIEIICDGAGRTTLHHRWELPAFLRSTRHHVSGLLAAAILGHAADDEQLHLACAGLDEFFLARIRQALAPNTSALAFFIPHDNPHVDMGALLSTIALLAGTVFRTSVPEEIEDVLLGQLRHLGR